jgi:hypothetical protein
VGKAALSAEALVKEKHWHGCALTRPAPLSRWSRPALESNDGLAPAPEPGNNACTIRMRGSPLMLDIATRFLAACVISYTIAVLMPTWRWLLGVTFLVAVLLYTDVTRHWIVACLQTSSDGPCGPCGFGTVLLYVATVGFASGVAIRGSTLLLQARGLRLRHVVMISIAGAALAPAIITFAPDVLTFSGPWSR